MIYTRLWSNLQRKTLAPMAVAGFVVMALTALIHGGDAFAAAASDLEMPDAIKMPTATNGIADEAGVDFHLAELKGKPVLINFWATWCAPCIAELPALSRAAEDLADDGISVLLISIDRGGASKALPFLEKHGVDEVMLGFDPRASLSREMGVRGLPTSFLVNADQTKAWQFVGPVEWDATDMLTGIRGLVAASD